MTLSSKIRIYDLAKELKVDTKRLIEEIRSEGADVSVPSNAISKGLAESIRIKYFPKKEAIAKRATQAAKKAKGPPRSQIVVIEPKKTPNGNQKERHCPYLRDLRCHCSFKIETKHAFAERSRQVPAQDIHN